MPADWVLSTGNGLLNPTAASTWTPTFPHWGIDFDPTNEAQALGFVDYASVILKGLWRHLYPPLSKISPQAIGEAAARQSAALGTGGVDLGMLSKRLLQDIPKKGWLGTGQLFTRVAVPLHLAQTLGGSTPSPTQTQQMISEPFTPAPVTAFLENLLGISPTVVPQTVAPANAFGGTSTAPPVPIITAPAKVGPRTLIRRARGGGAPKVKAV